MINIELIDNYIDKCKATKKTLIDIIIDIRRQLNSPIDNYIDKYKAANKSIENTRKKIIEKKKLPYMLKNTPYYSQKLPFANSLNGLKN